MCSAWMWHASTDVLGVGAVNCQRGSLWEAVDASPWDESQSCTSLTASLDCMPRRSDPASTVEYLTCAYVSTSWGASDPHDDSQTSAAACISPWQQQHHGSSSSTNCYHREQYVALTSCGSRVFDNLVHCIEQLTQPECIVEFCLVQAVAYEASAPENITAQV